MVNYSGAEDSHLRGGARWGFPCRPARNVQDCSRGVTVAGLLPGGRGRTLSGGGEAPSGGPRVILRCLGAQKNCDSERRHFESNLGDRVLDIRNLLLQLVGRKKGGNRSTAVAPCERGEILDAVL